MKTSNKIFIGLLTIIFLVINAFFIDLKVFGVHRSERRIVKHEEIFPLEKFSHIRIEGKKDKVTPQFNVKYSDKNQIEIASYSDTLIYSFTHQIVHDTLKIMSQADKPFMHTFTLYVNSKIESISSNRARIQLNGLQQENISIFLDGGEINSWGGDSNNFSKFDNAIIYQQNSRLNFHNLDIDTLHIKMDRSRAGFMHEIDFVDANIQNNSNLDLKSVSQLSLKKDSNSRIYVR